MIDTFLFWDCSNIVMSCVRYATGVSIVAYGMATAQGNFLQALEYRWECQRFGLEERLLTVLRVLYYR